MLTCEEAEPDLSAYLDGELKPQERAALEAHLVLCDKCNAVLSQIETAQKMLVAFPKLTAPATVAAKIRLQLSQSSGVNTAQASAERKTTELSSSANKVERVPIEAWRPRRKSFSWAAFASASAAALMLSLMGYVIFIRSEPDLNRLAKGTSGNSIADARADIHDNASVSKRTTVTPDRGTANADPEAQYAARKVPANVFSRPSAIKPGEEIAIMKSDEKQNAGTAAVNQQISENLQRAEKQERSDANERDGRRILEQHGLTDETGKAAEVKREEAAAPISRQELAATMAPSRRSMESNEVAIETPKAPGMPPIDAISSAAAKPAAKQDTVKQAPGAVAPSPVLKKFGTGAGTELENGGGDTVAQAEDVPQEKSAMRTPRSANNSTSRPQDPSKGSRPRGGKAIENDPVKDSPGEPVAPKTKPQMFVVKLRTRSAAATEAQVKVLAQEFGASIENNSAVVGSDKQTDESKKAMADTRKDLQYKVGNKPVELEPRLAEFTLNVAQSQRSALLNRLYALQTLPKPEVSPGSADQAQSEKYTIQGNAGADSKVEEKVVIKVELIAE